ncbi:hypothetical protein M0R36_10485 [bacterium]|nr:hypothetical protein [bacterium]
MIKYLNLADYRFKKIQDSAFGPGSGWLEIYNKSNSQLLFKSNKIVYDGREIFAQRVFGEDRVLGSGDKDLFLRYMSVGTGGTDPGDPNLPLDPDLEDHGLNTEIVIDVTDPDCTPDGRKKKFLSVEYLQDMNNNNRNLIAKATMVIGRTQCNGLSLNEAGLWFTDNATPALATRFVLASRITFPSITKNDTLELVLAWYYFM